VIKYEAVFILDPRRVEGNGEDFSTSIVEQIQELGGNVLRVKCLDKKVFARPIGKHKAGIYWDYVAEMAPDCVEKLQDKYRLNKTVLRLAVFKFIEGQDDEVFKPREERLFKEENFQDDIFEERSYRNYRSR